MKRPDARGGRAAAAGPGPEAWAELLRRHDPVWEVLPPAWEHGAFIGDGRLGAMVYLTPEAEGKQLIWELGRGDAYDPQPDPGSAAQGGGRGILKRLLIGRFVLRTAAPIIAGNIRLDLWNAELTGVVQTAAGDIRWRSWVPHEDGVIVIAWEGSAGEAAGAFEWQPHPGRAPTREPAPGPGPHPPGHWQGPDAWVQPFAAGGDLVTAWRQVRDDSGGLLLATIGYEPAGGSALAAARRLVEVAAGRGAEELAARQQAWWHSFYPASFVTIPDARLEGFYYLQLYKMAAATRPDCPVMDLCGPWLRPDTTSPAIWWNLNLQLAYWMHLAANHLELGEALVNTVDRSLDALIDNCPAEYREDSAFLGNPSGPDLRNARFTAAFAPITGGPRETVPEVNCLPWLCHNYFWQYRYTMDDELLRRLFPVLRRALNLLLHLLDEGDDGRLHLPPTLSAEYGAAADCCQDLAITRWGCRTLLWSAARLGIDDPLAPRWREVLERLVDYPRDVNGLMIGRDLPMAVSHRHWSHLMAIWPFYEINPTCPGGADLIRRGVEHWTTIPIIRLEHEFAGYTWGAAAAMMAIIGDGDAAAAHLQVFLDGYIHPNTLYTEGHQGRCPTIETPLMACRSLQEMLLQSWGEVIRVFPAVPAAWGDAAFHQLRAEGAFLVSAARRDGATRWVQVTSLAGEPCRLHLGMRGPIWSDGPEGLELFFPGDGVVQVNLTRGQTVLFFNGNERPDTTVAPLPVAPEQGNAFGLKRDYRPPFFMRPVTSP